MSRHTTARAPRPRQEPLPAFAIGVAAAIDLVAAGALLAGPISWVGCGVALLLHLIGTGWLMRGRRLRGRHRSRFLAISLAIPVAGAPVLLLALSRNQRPRGAASPGPIRQVSTEGVSAAISFEMCLHAHRRVLAAKPTPAAALATGNWIAHGIEVGLVDGRRRKALVREARRHFATAHALGAPAADVALARARLELAVRRPDRALDLLDELLPQGAGPRLDELRRLRDEAALRSRELPWECPSLPATGRGRMLAPDWRQIRHDRSVRATRPFAPLGHSGTG